METNNYHMANTTRGLILIESPILRRLSHDNDINEVSRSLMCFRAGQLVRPLVYQINFPPFSTRVSKKTKELKFKFGIFAHTELSISFDFNLAKCYGY